MASGIFALGKLDDNINGMIDRFEANLGGTYENPVLNEAVAQHASTQRFHEQIRQALSGALVKAGGDLSALAPDKVIVFGRPHYDEWTDLYRGLQIAINDTWAYDVYVDEYRLSGRCFSGKYRLVIWDHFGLDEPDVRSDKPAGYGAGFRAWFVLQHFKRFGYKPFLTRITLGGNDFSGRLST